MRDATDGVFKLFDTTTENLSTASAVTFGANSINMADLYVGQLGLEDIYTDIESLNRKIHKDISE